MIRFLPGVLLLIIGLAVFSLPYWAPLVSDVRVEPEAFKRSGQVGGGVIGVGAALIIAALIAGRKRG